MRTLLFTTLLVGLFVAPNLNAQVSLEMQPTEANAVITDVTLYRNRAAVTRTATLELDTGGHAIFFRDLPSVAYLDSIQASVSDNASLLSVDTSSVPTLADNSKLVAELVAEIEEVEILLANVTSTSEAIQLQIEMLKTLIEKASNDKSPPVDIEAFDSQITFVGKRMQELTASQAANEKEKQELKKRLQNLKQRKQNITNTRRTQIDAVVDIGATSKSTVTVKLTYLVNTATWIPNYSIHANTEGNTITIDYDAELTQKTGENWTDVALTLSTAQPQQSITPPYPRPWYVDVYQPQATAAAPSAAPRLGRTRAMADASYEVSNKVAMGLAVETASAAAAILGDGPAVSFVLPRTVTVPSNATESQTTSIASIETSAEHYLIAVPMLTDRVFVRSEVTNESNYILLPGRASIFHGGDYVGKTTLSTISPSETFPLDLGIEPSVIATRTLVEKVTSSTGLFGSGKQTLYDYQIKISNGNNEPIDIRVFDRIPISRNEEIEVLLKNLSSPLSTNVNYLKTERPQGILRWDLTIPANVTGDQSFTMTWQVEIARGKDIELSPLPE
jgi:uncharacterized protein (TIGR02231 family)